MYGVSSDAFEKHRLVFSQGGALALLSLGLLGIARDPLVGMPHFLVLLCQCSLVLELDISKH